MKTVLHTFFTILLVIISLSRKTTLIVIAFLMLSTLTYAQNIDYNAKITQFYGSNCGKDSGWSGKEEHTWNGWISDNVNTTETFSGCITKNYKGATTQSGIYANRIQNNVAATQLKTRIDAWEDDSGSRCIYNSGFYNDDDCRANMSCNYVFSNPNEYQSTTATQTCGSSDYNMRVEYDYKYTTVPIADAVDNNSVTYSTGGNRPFWGSSGSWAFSGSDCATSGTITDNQTSSFSTTIKSKSSVSFRWKVSSENQYDWLDFWIDGVREDRISGTPGWAQKTYPLTSDQHVLEWRYVKDGSVAKNEDRGFVDQVTFVNALALPVDLVSFDGWNDESSNILKWTTASELNSDRFEIQRSMNGIRFEKIGELRTASNSVIFKHYEFVDKKPISGVNYYRLKQVDHDGSHEYSPIVTVRYEGKGVSIYPNPVSTVLHIERSSTYTIHDMLGSMIMSGSGDAIDVSMLQSGTYIIKTNGEVQRFVKM